MSDEKKEFDHDSLQDREQVVAYLRSVADGLESGVLRLSDPTRQIELKPRGLMSFNVRAQTKRSRVVLTLRCSWKQPDEKKSSGDNGPLKIESSE